jgi:hypothetical protein
MIDSSQPGFWIAIAIGGSLIASASAYQQYTSNLQGQEFSSKPVIRDFCIGAFITAVIYMFLPDTIQAMLSSGQTAASDMLHSMTKDSASSVSASASGNQGLPNDIELQTGPARF